MQARSAVAIGVLVVGALLALPAQAQADDEDGPTLRSIALSARTVAAGSTLTVTLDVADATGVAQVFVEIRGPQDKLRLHSVKDAAPICENGQGQRQAVLACPFELPSTLPAGTYDVWALQLNDVLWNSEHYRSPDHFQEDALHQLTFTVQSDNHDLEGPVAQRIEVLTPTVPAGDKATFRVTASDATGLRTLGLGVLHANGSPWTSGSCTVSGTSGPFDCQLPIPAVFPAGTYNLLMLSLVDVNGVATYHDRSATGSFAGVEGGAPTLQVTSQSTDTSRPSLVRFQAPAVPVVRGQQYQVHVWAAEEDRVASAFSVFQNQYGSRQYWRRHLDVQPADCTAWVSASVPMVCTDTVPDWFALGRVDLSTIFLKDTATNEDQWTSLPHYGGKQVTQDGLNRTQFWIVPRPLGESGLPSLVALEPQVSQIVAGTVLPVTGLLDDSVATGNLTFSFRSAAGQVVGATGCDPQARPDVIGFLCGLILPPATPVGRYVLDEVALARPDGSVAEVQLPAAPPAFEVLADPAADEGAPLPAGWTEYVSGTLTTARFNSGPGLPPLRAAGTAAQASIPPAGSPASSSSNVGNPPSGSVGSSPAGDQSLPASAGDADAAATQPGAGDGGLADGLGPGEGSGSSDGGLAWGEAGHGGDGEGGGDGGGLVPAVRDAPAPALLAVLAALGLALPRPRQRR